MSRRRTRRSSSTSSDSPRDPLPIMILVVFPLLLIGFLKPMFALALTTHGYPGANGAEQVVPGEAVINGFYIVGMTSFAFFVEHGWNTWDRLRASDASSLEIVTSKALPFLAVSVAQFLIIFAIGIPLFQLHSHGPLAASVPLVVAFALCLVTLGIMITSVCHTVQQVSALAFGGLGPVRRARWGTRPRWRYSRAGLTRCAGYPDLLGHARLRLSDSERSLFPGDRAPLLDTHWDESCLRCRVTPSIPLHGFKGFVLALHWPRPADSYWPFPRQSCLDPNQRICSPVRRSVIDDGPHGTSCIVASGPLRPPATVTVSKDV